MRPATYYFSYSDRLNPSEVYVRYAPLSAASFVLALAACEPTTTAPPSGTATSQPARSAPAADSQMINGAQRNLNRYGYGSVDANTLTRDQVIRLNRIETRRQGQADTRLEISAILG